MTTRVVLIRHAPVDTQGRLCGSFDVPLTAAGQAQVDAMIRRRPARAAPDVLYTSTLMRARDVAAALGRAWERDPRPAEWAREIYCGEVEGMPLDRVREHFSESWLRNEAQDDDEFAWPGGETYSTFRGRVLQGLQDIAMSHAGTRVAVVTHAGVIAQILGALRRRPAAVWGEDRPDPLTATEVMCGAAGPTALVTFNDPDFY